MNIPIPIPLFLIGDTLYEIKDYEGDEAESCNNCGYKRECDKSPGDFACEAYAGQNYVRYPRQLAKNEKRND